MRRFTFFLVAVATRPALSRSLAPPPATRTGNPPPTLPTSLTGIATGSGSPRPMKQAT